MMKAAFYGRYSSENQKESSIADQFRNCEQYSKREGWTITQRYEDQAISGSTSERPGYQRLLADAKAHVFDVLLVDDFSRLSRDQVETEQVRRRMVHWGIRLIGISDGIDTSSKGHKMLASFKGIMNEVFLDDLREKTRRGMIGQVLKGYHGGGRSYGYKLVPEHQTDSYGQMERIGTRLEADPEQARWVRWIFEQYADGWRPLKIVEELNRQGVPPPGVHYRRKSAKLPSWCVSALFGNVRFGLGMLNNRLYRGEQTWGRARWTRCPDTGRKRRTAIDEQEWIRRPAEHLRLVDDELWARVKQRQATIHDESAAIRTALHLSPTTSTGRGPRYLFSGLLSCAQCQHKFVIVDPRHYGCGGWKYRGLSVCRNTIKVSRAVVESVLLEAIQRDLFTEEGQALFIRETTKLLTEQRRTQKPDHEKTAMRLREVDQEIEHIMAAIKQGILTPTTKTALENAEAERATLVETVQGPHRHEAKVAAFLPNAIGRFKTLVENLATVTQPQVDKARACVRTLVGGTILLHPTADGDTRYLTAEVTGDYAGLLRLATGKIKVVEGRGVEPPTPTLRT